MKPFDYIVPATLEEALTALSAEDARPIAGGQNLLLELKERQSAPARLVSLGGLPELGGWRQDDSGELIIGPATTYAALHRATLPGWHGVLSAAAGDLADRPVRTMGTIGGALCQADPRYDMPVLAVGLDARIELAAAAGRREVSASELFPAAGGTTLRRGEILTAIRLPALDRFTAAAFEKVRQRVFDAADASAVCALRLDSGGRVQEARITVGAVGPVPLVLEAAAAALRGVAPAEADLTAAVAEATEAVDATVSGTARRERYRRELVAVVVRRALTTALDHAGS